MENFSEPALAAGSYLTFSPVSPNGQPVPHCSLQISSDSCSGYITTQNDSNLSLSNPITAPMVSPPNGLPGYGFCSYETGAFSAQMVFILLIPTTSTAVPCITYCGYNSDTQTIALFAGYSSGQMQPQASTYNSFTLQGSLVGVLPKTSFHTMGINIDIEYDPATVPLPPGVSNVSATKRGTVIVVPITSPH